MAAEADHAHMTVALGLARRALGLAAPNPAVGCVLVGDDGRVVGRGWTQPGGRPHAEAEALARAGAAARGATAYVTLEPCSHHGRVPPCADALVAAGISRAVIALRDPDPRVNGAGIARLEAAGISVQVGVCAAEAAALNAGFLTRIALGRPQVTAKLASTLDGRIATAAGESRWITGEPSRRQVHRLRAEHDAVMVGSRTATMDDPELTCRLPGLEHRSPVRIVVDGRLRLPLTAKLVATARSVRTLVFTLPAADPPRRKAMANLGIEVVEVPADPDGYPDMRVVLAACAGQGFTRLLVEGGSHLVAGFLRADLVDTLVWFHAPALLGADGLAAVQSFGVKALSGAARFRRDRAIPLGEDLMEVYVRDREPPPCPAET